MVSLFRALFIRDENEKDTFPINAAAGNSGLLKERS